MKYVEGAENFDRILARMRRAAREEIGAALTRSGGELAAAARILAPRSEDGAHVADDIAVSPLRAGSRGLSVQVTAGTSPETAVAGFRSEFGRQPSADGHPGHAPQPFFFVAYAALRRRLRARIRRAVAKAARRAVQGGR